MMTEGSPENPHPPADEEDPALWRLLERAPRLGPVSPYFARRVLREVAALEEASPAAREEASGWLARLWRPWQGQARGVFAGGLAAVALLAVGVKMSPTRWSTPGMSDSDATAASPANGVDLAATGAEASSDDGATPATLADEPPVAAQDVEVIANLDNLLSSEESRLWTDEDTTARY